MLKKIAAATAALATGATLMIGGMSMADASTTYSRDDYGPNPHSSNATDPSWGPAEYPNCPSDTSKVNYSDLDAVAVRDDLVPLVRALLEKTEEMGYDVRGEATWGYDCRPIRGSNKPSNHSRGLAVDLNSDKNPMSYEFSSDIPPEVVHMWESAGFYWGGRYSSRFDTMHFEYIGSVSEVAGYTEQVTGSPAPEPKPEPEPDPEFDWCTDGPTPLIHSGSQGGPVKDAQCLLNRYGYDAGTVDGVFGPRTDEAVRAFQRDAGLEVDGYIGPKTWAALGHEL